jgi:hypothetical protein
MPDEQDVTPEEIEEQDPELLPDREAMSIITPFPREPEIYYPPDAEL